jgi:hypothetical protein
MLFRADFLSESSRFGTPQSFDCAFRTLFENNVNAAITRRMTPHPVSNVGTDMGWADAEPTNIIRLSKTLPHSLTYAKIPHFLCYLTQISYSGLGVSHKLRSFPNGSGGNK